MYLQNDNNDLENNIINDFENLDEEENDDESEGIR